MSTTDQKLEAYQQAIAYLLKHIELQDKTIVQMQEIIKTDHLLLEVLYKELGIDLPNSENTEEKERE